MAVKAEEKQKPIVSLVSWLMFIGLGLIWGASFILIKKSLVAFSPQQVACLRISITALVFLPFLASHFHKVGRRHLKHLAVVGFLGSFLPFLCFAYAQTKISSSLAGVLNSLTPLFTLLLGIAFFSVKGSWTKILGVGIGLVGAIWLMLIGRNIGDLTGLQYGLLVVVGCVFYGISNNVVKHFLSSMQSAYISAVSYCIVGVPALIYLLFSDFVKVMKTHKEAWHSLGSVTLLALMGTVVASVFFFKLIKDTSALFAASVCYLIPVVALMWGFADGESVTVFHVAGMAMILSGVYISQK